jgi:predicted dehydrogenase
MKTGITLSDSKHKKIKVAVVGCGNWGKNLIRVFHQTGALAAICDIVETKAQEFSQKYNVPYYNFNQILQTTDIDAVVIATPSTTHFELGMACLKANKHLFIEKPLALRVEHALLLKQQAAQQQKILMVGHLLQYHGAFNTIKQLYQTGALGELQYIYCNRLNFGKFPSEESVLWDYAPHDISMILSLIGKMPTRVIATSTNHLHHTHVDSSCIHLHFENNIQAHIFVSWLHPYKEQRMVIIGSKAMVIFDDCQPLENKLQLCRYPEEWKDGLPRPFLSCPEKIALAANEPLLNECRHFLQSIEQLSAPITSGTEAIKVMTVLEAAAQSISTHLPVEPISKQIDIRTVPERLEEASA